MFNTSSDKSLQWLYNLTSERDMEKRITVYVIENYFLSRRSLIGLLGKDFDVLGDFETTNACLDAMAKKQPDVVVMGTNLKYDSEFEDLQKIMLHFPDVKIAIIAETNEKLYQAYIQGVNTCIFGEVSPQKMSAIIKLTYAGFSIFNDSVSDLLRKGTVQRLLGEPDFDVPNAVLTARELQILRSIVKGKYNCDIAKEFVISTNTVKAHVSNIIKKLKVKNRSEAAAKAVRDGLV